MSAPRVPPIEPGTRAELAALEARIRASRGSLLKIYRVLLNSPPLADGWEAFFTAVRQKTSIPARLRELAILRIAVLNGARYEFAAHLPHARAAGLAEETIAALGAGREPPGLDALDRLVLELADTMTRAIEVPDDLYAALAAHFSPREIVELVATIAAYNMVSRFLVALRIEPDGDAQ
ncbi:MAG: carboxymuconolactone decarboxylase family protein [Burkholderiales bacterium]|nr:carboxymuconolactone decarboxylase family protein [Burkholderiales bacterium]